MLFILLLGERQVYVHLYYHVDYLLIFVYQLCHLIFLLRVYTGDTLMKRTLWDELWRPASTRQATGQ